MAEIDGLKVVYAPTYKIDERDTVDKVKYPFELYANLRPPEFMQFAFAAIYGGSEEFTLRAVSRDKLIEAAVTNGWIRADGLDAQGLRAWKKGHPRLRRIIVTAPDGTTELLAGSM